MWFWEVVSLGDGCLGGIGKGSICWIVGSFRILFFGRGISFAVLYFFEN